MGEAIFVSVWDGGYQVESSAKYDPETQTVFDVEMVDPLEDHDILDGEYAEIDGVRYELEDNDDGTYKILM